MKYLAKIQYIFLLIGLGIWGYGWIDKNFNLLALGILCVFIQNILFSIRKIKNSIAFLVFQITVFTFLLARPILGCLAKVEWWSLNGQSEENVYATILMVSISLVAMYVGAEIALKITLLSSSKNNVDSINNIKRQQFIEMLRLVSLIVFAISVFFLFLQEREKILFMRNHTYLEFYSLFESKLPGIVYTIAGFMKYSLCLYLATFPSKKQSFVPMIVFWVSGIPSLLVGVRNVIIMNSIFIFIYYFIRDLYDTKEKWIGKIEKILLIVSIPFVIIFMYAYAFIRTGNSTNSLNPIKMFFGFFWDQSTTFGFISQGYGHRLNLPVHEWGNYTFGGVLDYLVYGRVGQMLFHTEPLPSGNNVINAHQSHNLSHNLSYTIMKDRYLNGQGVGSSYVFENYLDWGFIGVFLFSVVLGCILILLVHFMQKNTLMKTISLMCLTTIFLAPRAEATGWLDFIVTIQFWACILACYLGANIIVKVDWMYKISNKIAKKIRII